MNVEASCCSDGNVEGFGTAHLEGDNAVPVPVASTSDTNSEEMNNPQPVSHDGVGQVPPQRSGARIIYDEAKAYFNMRYV
jgi:hypothetical protein